MFNIKISDFQGWQIDLLLETIEEKLEIIQLTQMRTDLWDESQIRTDIMNKCSTDLDCLTLWKIQLMNAKSDLKEMQTSNQ